MPAQPTCRLCLEYCTEGYCDLYNEDFQVDCETTAATAANEVFDMVRKYFPEDVGSKQKSKYKLFKKNLTSISGIKRGLQ